jgi:choline dehydrogenase-like flavoprotein
MQATLGGVMIYDLKADVIVVGSGAGGAAVAGELASAGRKVLVLEAGGRIAHWPRSHARSVDPSEAGLDRYRQELEKHLVFPSRARTPIRGLSGFKVAHVFGGMFALWTCNCPWPDDLELPPWDDGATWRRYIAKAQGLLHVTSDIGRNGVRMKSLIEAARRTVGNLPVGREVQPMPVAARTIDGKFIFSTSDDLLRSDGPGSTLEVRTDIIIRKVLHDGRRAVGVTGALPMAVPRSRPAPTA